MPVDHPGHRPSELGGTSPGRDLRPVIWMPDTPPRQYFGGGSPDAGHQRWAARPHCYTSAVGDQPKITPIRSLLRQLDFDPHVFKKEARHSRSKAVDITLTRDMLSGAFLGSYDAAVLIAGDGDYLPIIEEVKRLGKRVSAAFFSGEGLGLTRRSLWSATCSGPWTKTFSSGGSENSGKPETPLVTRTRSWVAGAYGLLGYDPQRLFESGLQPFASGAEPVAWNSC